MDVAVVGVVALLFVLATPGICITLPFKNKYAVAVSHAIVFTAVYYALRELVQKRNEGFALLQSNMSDPICPEGMTFNKELGKCVEEIYAFDPTCPEGTTLNKQRGGCVEEVYTNLSAPNNSGKGCDEDACEEDACEEDACEASPSCSQGKVYLKNSNKCATGTGTDTLIKPICPEGYTFSKDNNKCMRPMNNKNGGTIASTAGSTSRSTSASTSGSNRASTAGSTSGSTSGSTTGSTTGSTAASTIASNKASTPGSTTASTIASTPGSTTASTMASTVASTIAAAPYWDILNAPNMTANTWDEMNQVCADKGQRLCGSKDLCPSNQPIADMNIFGGSDNWMAVNDTPNEWVTYNKADGRMCKTHTQVAGGGPGWGDSNSSEYSFYRAAKCCPKPPTVASTTASTIRPTMAPTIRPTMAPTIMPAVAPTIMPATASIMAPTIMPATASTMAPTIMPTTASTIAPAAAPAAAPAVVAAAAPAVVPAAAPVVAPAAAPVAAAPAVVPGSLWNVLNTPNTTAKTWKEMNDICTATPGYRLCSSKELCPSGQPIADMNKEFGGSDNWMAVNDTPNEWLTYRAGRVCKTHTDIGGGVPAWGETTTAANMFRAAKCCPATAAAPAAAPVAAPVAAPAAVAPTSITLKKEQIVGSVNIPTGNYTLSFTITIRGIIGGWGSIIQVTRGGNEDRAPGIWVTPGKTTLHIVFGDETDGNWRIDETDPLQIGQPVNVSISANGSDVSATVGSKTYTLKQPTRRLTGKNFIIYMTDPWQNPANAAIENIKYVVDGVTVTIAPTVAPAAAPALPWDVLNTPNTTAKTWKEMNQVCADKSQRLCSAKELCPSGQPIADMNKEISGSDNWMAVNDKENEWLTYTTFNGRMCKTHTQIAGGGPEWGKSTSAGNWIRAAKCCPK